MTSSEQLFKIPLHLSYFWDLLGNACVQLVWFNLYGKADLKHVLAVLTGQAQLREISKEHRRKDTALRWKFRLVCVCVCVYVNEAAAQMKSTFCFALLNWLRGL